VDEGDGTVVITVTLNSTSPVSVTVDYATSDGTASAGSDYIPTNGTLIFAPGQTSRTFDVLIIDDTQIEPDETFMVTLSNPANATLGTPNPATVTIINNDFPTVQFSSASYSVDEDRGPALITATLNVASPLTATVTYSTSNGSALAGSDYVPAYGILTFAPGITTRTFTVTIINDRGEEPDETLSLTLSNPLSAMLGIPYTATLVIVDDDAGAGPCDGQPYPARPIALGRPDCFWTDVSPGSVVTLDLGTTPITVTGASDPAFDLVYYERESPAQPGRIALDMVQIEVSTDNLTFYEVFNWGNAVADTNTNIGQAGYVPPELNDQTIPMSMPPLYGPPAGLITGIAIDVDNPPAGPIPTGTYRYVRLTATAPIGQATEIDAIEVLP
jgi:hypothetical protein